MGDTPLLRFESPYNFCVREGMRDRWHSAGSGSDVLLSVEFRSWETETETQAALTRITSMHTAPHCTALHCTADCTPLHSLLTHRAASKEGLDC